MWTWIKSLFSSSKTILRSVIDTLDLLVPFLANRLEEIRAEFAKMDSMAKAQWIVNYVQAWLRKRFNLDA